jgi:beta-fructofuranosidase
MIFDRRRFLGTVGFGAAGTAMAPWAKGMGLAGKDLADDTDRPEYHFLAPHNWMNDPNGPIWWKGKYHLFYQLNPAAAVWGDMHWGHAVSTDMVHWRHEAIALAPTPGGPDSEGCFSGSAVVRDGVPTVIYTGVQNAAPELVTLHDGNDKLRETVLLAVAEDEELLRWKKRAEPVIAKPPEGMAVTGFRDPCPWREADGWYMAVGSGERGKGGYALLYRSQDLRAWEYLHPLASGKPNGLKAANPCDSGEMWECPDFFEVNGQHCLLYSTEGKVIWTTGEYDRHTHRYTAKRTGVLDHGAFYAPKSFAAPDGRRILWGWIQETRSEAEFAAAGWAGMMSLPRVLTVDTDGQLEMRVAAEYERLRGREYRVAMKPETEYVEFTQVMKQTLPSLRQEFEVKMPGKEAAVKLRLTIGGKTAWEISIDGAEKKVTCGEKSFGLPDMGASDVVLRMWLDGSAIESLVCGKEAITSRVYGMKPGKTEIEVLMRGKGEVELVQWPLGAISGDRLTA